MLLASRIDEKTVIFIDAEAAGGINKGSDEGMDFSPDKAVDNILQTVAGMAKRLGELLDQNAFVVRPPHRLEINFGVRVNSLGAVSVSQTTDHAQFRVSVEWRLAT